MTFELWIVFFTAYLVITLIPGPNVLLVLRNAHHSGYLAAISTIAGNLSCQLLVIIAVAFGAGALLVSLPTVFLIYKVIGGGYLVYLGIMILFRKTNEQEPLLSCKARPDKPNYLKTYKSGFVISLANPKTIIFLSAFLPQFISPSTSLAPQFTVMFITISAIVLAVHLAYCIVSNHLSRKLLRPYLKVLLSKFSGIVFISFGGKIMLESGS